MPSFRAFIGFNIICSISPNADLNLFLSAFAPSTTISLVLFTTFFAVFFTVCTVFFAAFLTLLAAFFAHFGQKASIFFFFKT